MKKKQKQATKQAVVTSQTEEWRRDSRWPRPRARIFNRGDAVSLKAQEDREEAYKVIDRAEYFQDFSLLTDRLRNGTASREEMQIAANFIEGKYQPEIRSRGGQYTASFGRSVYIERYVMRLVKSGKSKKAAVSLAAEEFNLSVPRIYAALKEVADCDHHTSTLLRKIFNI